MHNCTAAKQTKIICKGLTSWISRSVEYSTVEYNTSILTLSVRPHAMAWARPLELQKTEKRLVFDFYPSDTAVTYWCTAVGDVVT